MRYDGKTISLLGSGWLGRPLAEYFVSKGCHVKATTTSKNRLQELSLLKIEPFILDIGQLPSNVHDFLQANILIVNIPSKNINGFYKLIKEIENSEIEKVLFVSSTSVYKNQNKTVFETDTEALKACSLLMIEYLFRENSEFKATVIRFGGLIGYNRNPGNFFKDGRIVQSPEANVNLIHRDDCISIIGQIVEQNIYGEVFNCCADTHPTKREFYTQAAKKIAVTPPSFDESGAKSFKIISNQKVKKILNCEFLYPDLMDLYVS